MKFDIRTLETDVLIIGGGTAGCFSALKISENSNLKVIITDKAKIKRSGCLAAGVNAINAYIGKSETPESFVEYVKRDSEGIIREDLVYGIAKRLNKITKQLEDLGLPILKDENGEYVQRGKRSIKINGENIKPLLAGAVTGKDNITVLNNVNIVDYLRNKDGHVIGAAGFSLKENKIYEIYAKKTICATGGASGIYKPNNPAFSRHKMWYSPFNTGAGYAMGIRAGAEMTSFEMRFIALRCKDTIAPTGTIAQGVKAPQINGKGEEYVEKYGNPTTHIRLYSTVMENLKGNGPCFLKTEGISEEQQEELFKAYLNMAPAQTLKWIEGEGPSDENVEIEGTEPYIVGGHTASGYWIDSDRRTTLKNLYAVGDVAGGSPKKYVTGCMAEGEIAAMSIINSIEDTVTASQESKDTGEKIKYISGFFNNPLSQQSIPEIETAMQKIMDEYAGGISKAYMYNKKKLEIADRRIEELFKIAHKLKADSLFDLLAIFEIIDRLYVCKVLIKHLAARKETRWRCYQENVDFPDKDDKNWMKYVNSVYKDGNVEILFRQLVGRDKIYEHTN